MHNSTDSLKLNFTYNTPNQNDNNGNVLSQTITVPTVGAATGFTAVQTYTYDSLNRIKDADEKRLGYTQTDCNQNPDKCWKQTFVYDRYGNRTFDEGSVGGQYKTTTLPRNCGTAPNITVCAKDNPQPIAASNKLLGIEYDSAGNTRTDLDNRRFTYDGENKQIKVETTDGSGNVTGTLGEYFYDGDGKRVKKVSLENSQWITTIFVYDASGKMVAEYSTIVASAQDAKVSYLTQDHLGSPRITTDQNGAVISRRDFQPFGEEIARANYGTDAVRQKFTGYEKDEETNLDFAQARMYANHLGRFTTVDPLMASAKTIRPESWNRYVYCYNNPLIFIDPDGMEVKVLGDKAKENVLLTLPENIRKQVAAKIDKDGLLKKGSLDKIKSKNANFTDLKKLVNNKTTVEVATSDTDPLNGEKFYYKSNEDFVKESVELQMKYGVPEKEAKKEAEELAKTIKPTDRPLKGGVTLSPDQSPSGNWRVILPDGTGDASDFPKSETATSTAHELYVHALSGVQGKPWVHELDETKNYIKNGPVNAQTRVVETRTRNMYKKP